MSGTPFIVSSDAVQLGTAAIAATDTFRNGLLVAADESVVRAALAGGAEVTNGLLMSDAGQVIYTDATAGLPADATYCNGFPLTAAGELCISTDPFSTYNNGTPMAANGAVAAVITP